MKRLIALFLLCVVVRGAEVLRPRGVPLSKTSFYDPTRDFSCLDGSGTIPFSYVNDDYCDCQDGSDEPGTAACPNGSFHCTNAGHSPLTLPSSRVNDGVCDCCDASDEYASSANCVDFCRELGRAAREEAVKKKEEQLRGFQLRQAMIEDGQKRKKEAQSKLEELKNEKTEAEAVRTEKEVIKKDAEEPEKEALDKYRTAQSEKRAQEQALQKEKEEEEAREAFTHLDNNGDGVLSMEELMSRQTFDQNRDGQVSEDEARFFLDQEDTMTLEKFIATGWALMRPVYLMDQRMFTPPSTTSLPPPEEELTPPPPVFDEEDPYMTDDELDDEEDEERYGEEEVENLNPDMDPEDDGTDPEDYDMRDEYHDEDDKDDEEESKNEEEEDPKYDEETQALVNAANEAREQFDEADRRVRDLTREVRSLEETQEKDYGPEQEFRVLEGNCYDFTDREYVYQLCPFDKATQKPKSGHGETRLGQWGEWTGAEGNKYIRMLYSNGQACWNGPTRSADVHISCGIENKLIGVSEPNRCEYVFLFSSPAVCTRPEEDLSEETARIHTEL